MMLVSAFVISRRISSDVPTASRVGAVAPSDAEPIDSQHYVLKTGINDDVIFNIKVGFSL